MSVSQASMAVPSASVLRGQLVAMLEERGHIRTPSVRRAFRSVERELFLPGVDLETAYTRRQIVIKRDAAGAALSSASSPSLVADMLEQLDLRPGQRVLEIGAATGINAALLAELTGPDGAVTTIELDQDLADGARTGLNRAGYRSVEVICGDGALGHPSGAPYDRIIVTAGAWDIPPAWWDQLAVGGRLVVPLRIHESGLTRCFAFDRISADELVSTTTPLVCGFVPLRGSVEHADHHVRLGADVALKLDPVDLPDVDALSQCLSYPRVERWTGIEVGDAEPVSHLDLWLLINSDRSFGQLGARDDARAKYLVDPAYQWAGAAIYSGGTIAYLAFQAVDDSYNELGAVAHGPDAGRLAAELTDLLDCWDDDGRPNEPNVTADRSPITRSGQGVVLRPVSSLTIKF